MFGGDSSEGTAANYLKSPFQLDGVNVRYILHGAGSIGDFCDNLRQHLCEHVFLRSAVVHTSCRRTISCDLQSLQRLTVLVDLKRY